MEKLIVKDLCKTYYVNKVENEVIKHVNFEISRGDMVAIMGPSGSGKSTLLHLISGMDTMTSGEVDFFGIDISKLKANQMSELRLNEMGFIFQHMYMLSNLSVFDNIILPAYQSKKIKDKKIVNENAKELMTKMDILDIAEHDINEVSGGQLQRACICRSLINNPKILFADEPTGALNQQNSREVMNKLNEINKKGTTIVIVTHDMKVAARCEYIIYFEDGDIRGKYSLGKYNENDSTKREAELLKWLSDMGW